MSYNFSNISVLVVNDVPSTLKIMTTALKIHQTKSIYGAMDTDHALNLFNKHKPDIIITELNMQPTDGKWLAKKIRESSDNTTNREVPIIIITSDTRSLSIPDVRDAGFNELLIVPFSVDSIASRIAYTLNNPKDFIDSSDYIGPDRRFKQNENHEGPFRRETDPDDKKLLLPNKNTPEHVEEKTLEDWPPAEESEELLHTLFEHYIQHSEILLKKLRHAQTATKQSMDEGEGKQDQLSDFERMWQEIIDLFLGSGLSETDIYAIEKLITTIPDDIGQHYKKLSEQDESLKELVKNLDPETYKKASNVATKLQDKPNPLSGLSAQNYKDKAKSNKSESPVQTKALKFTPIAGKFKA